MRVACTRGAVTLFEIDGTIAAPWSAEKRPGAAGRLETMSGEAEDIPGLGPAMDRAPPGRSRWARRSPGRLDGGLGSDRGGPSYAALDLGTNNCRLLVARPAGDGFRVIDAFSRIIRLGEGVIASGHLSDAAIERAIAALAICRNKMKNRGVTRARLIATEACRAAANGNEFLSRVAEELGIV